MRIRLLLLSALNLSFACECLSQQSGGMNVSGFALVPSPAVLTVYAGTAASTRITATGDSQMTADVEFAVTSPLPPGVTALLTRNPDGSSLLTLIAAPDAAPGAATVTVAGTSDASTATTTVALSINVPTFLLSISPIPFTISAGSTTNSTVTVVPWGNFTGAVNLSGYQLPPGVHATFSQPSTTATSTLMWTADTSAPSGASAAIIAGNATGMTSYSQFQQIVSASAVPSFTVGVSPAYLTINQGATAADNIAVTVSNGFSGNVSLSVTQLPAGIKASLSPDVTSGKSVLTLSVGSSAAVGLHVLSVWGSAAGQSGLSPLYLIVQPTLGFTLGASPASLARGATTSTTIVVSRDSGSSEAVGLSIASTLPNGVTASLTPQAGTANYELSLSATAAFAPGNYFVNVCGTSGAQSITITIPVKVDNAAITAPPSFSVAGGTYAAPQTVIISDATPGAQIFFTTDGSAPTSAATPYSSPIVVASTQTLQAVAVASGYSSSSFARATYVIQSPGNPVPRIQSMSPAFTAAAGPAFTLTFTGSGFTQGSTAYWGSSPLRTQFVNSAMLAAQVPAGDIALAGLIPVTVQTALPGGGVSNTIQFEVDSASPSTGSAPPVFGKTTALISAGQTALYPVTLPVLAANVSATCLNLPAGSSCAYSGSASQISIQTATASPPGTYQVTVVFHETLTAPAVQGIAFPLFALPFALRRRRSRKERLTMVLSIALGLVFAVIFVAGCGKSASTPQGISAASPSQQVTTSGLVTLTIQ